MPKCSVLQAVLADSEPVKEAHRIAEILYVLKPSDYDPEEQKELMRKHFASLTNAQELQWLAMKKIGELQRDRIQRFGAGHLGQQGDAEEELL